MATSPQYVEQVQSNIPAWMQPYAQQLLGSVFGGTDPTTGQFMPGLMGQGYQPYMVPQRDAQGNIVRDAQGQPVMRPGQRVAEFSPLQRQAFDAYAGMKPGQEMADAMRLAREAGGRAGDISRYTAYGDQVPMGGVDNWGAGEKYDKSKLPSGFDWQAYLAAPQNADLVKAGIDTPEEAERHYAKYGSGEGRSLGTPGTSFESSAFYNPPSFQRMDTSFERASAPTLKEEQMAAPDKVSSREYGPIDMQAPERVGIGALQQYRVAAPERVAGPTGPERVSGTQLQQYQMGPAERVGAREYTAPQMTTARTDYRPDLQAFEMGPAERVGAEKFGLGAMQEYMSPYMQGVVERQKQAATRDYARQLPGMSAAAARAGAKGGTREALVQAEAQRGLQERLGEIEATGLQSAYQQAAQQFGADRAAQMQAALANQQAGLTTGQQNLQSRLGVQQLGTQTGLQTALANLSSEQQANVQNQAAQLQTQGLSADQAMRAALANQQAGLTVGQQNLAAQLQTQGLSSQQAMEIARLNQQGQLSTEQLRAEIAKANQAAGMTAEQANQQAALQVQQLGTQSGLQAGLANQAAMQRFGEQKAGMEQTRQQFLSDQAMRAALANQQAGLTTGQTNLQSLINQRQFGAGQGLQAQQLNQAAQLQRQQQDLAQLAAMNQFNPQNAMNRAQYGLAGANLREQSRQFGAGLGMQGIAQQLAAAQGLGGLGMQNYQQMMGIAQGQMGAGGQQQALNQQLLNQQYQDFINQQQFPYKQAEFGMGILRGLPATGQTSTMYQQPGSLFGQIAGTAAGIGGMFGALGG